MWRTNPHLFDAVVCRKSAGGGGENEEELMKTRVTELLGIEYPIIQGGMAWVAEHHLAAAVWRPEDLA